MDSSKGTEVAAARTSIDELAAQFLNRVFRRKEVLRRRTNRPWESWELDERFFRTLSRWTLENPETSLERILDDVREGLGNSKDLLGLIPDSPFPARGLVIALAHLFQLGVTISRAERDVYDFAKDVIRWVGQVKSAFESSDDGRFTWSAWHDLRHMRKLIDEICSWAVERLNDGRWSRIGHGLRIQGEIQEFTKRISDARSLFQDLSAINLSKGLDAILADLRRMLHRQRIIVDEIEKIRKTQERQLAELMDDLRSQKLAAERDRFLADALAGHIVTDPTYDKQGKRPCDANTRVKVLAEITKWVNNVSTGSQNFLWLTGDPGCGKSAVTASVAKTCKQKNVLWAQYFINRNIVETTNPNFYFPSIASQLARRSSYVAEALQTTLLKDRALTDAISADQAAKLFINSVRFASRLDPKQPVVITIDGLDETDRKRLEDTATIFSTLFTALEEYRNVKVIISSRTENEIQKSFVLPSNDKLVKRVHLDTAHPSSIRDVSQYIKRNLADLVKKHDLNWDVWPGDKRSRVLAERAAGLFIWGVTAIKFIEEQLESNGKECLSDVLDTLTADVLHDINSLYMLILQIRHGSNPSDWEIERFRRIVGVIVCLQEPLSIDDLAELLDLRKTPSSEPVDILHFVRRFRTILVAGSDAINGKTVPRIHKSVFEFITSDSVDAQFRVDPNHAQLELAMQCLFQLGSAKEMVVKDALSSPFRYAFRFWSSHLSQANMERKVMFADCTLSSLSSLPSTLFRPRVSRESSLRIVHSPAASQIETILGDYRKIWDASSGANLSGHTGTVTSMAFSLDGKHILSCSDDKTIRVYDTAQGLTWMRTLIKHSSPLHAAAFSPDARFVISGSEDGLVCLWDSFNGTLVGAPFHGHNDRVTCVAFSLDTERVVSGSMDGTCILWNIWNGRMIGEPWAGHATPVILVAFSSSGRRACSIDNEGYIFHWDAGTGQKISSWRYGDLSSLPKSVSFSHQDEDVIAVGGRYGIEIRSRNQRMWSIPDSDWAYCLSFSRDGKLSFVSNNTITSATISKDECITGVVRGRFAHQSSLVRSPALSPNFDYFAYSDSRDAIRLFACQYNKNEAAIETIPIDHPMPNVQADNEIHRIVTTLSDMQLTHNTMTKNRRLDAIKWYEKNSDDIESIVRLVVARDDGIVSAFSDGSVSVWKNSAEDV